MKSMIKNKPFWALFCVQFLQAFNDNFFRATLITLITYHVTAYSESEKSFFISAAFGLFMLPYFLFSPLAGQLADAYDKAKIIRSVKVAELLIISLSAYGFIAKDPYFLLSSLFFMGTHSAFFGPAKYGILPDLLSQKRLLRGNSYMEAGTFLALMLGGLFGALMIHLRLPLFLVSCQMICIALLGLLMSCQIPIIPRVIPHLRIHLNWLVEMKCLYSYTRQDTRVFKAVIGIAWFWLIDTLFLTQLPPLAHTILMVEENAFIFLLVLFTTGISLGSILCNWLLKGAITTQHVPLLAFLMVPILFDISSFSEPLASNPLPLSSLVTSFQGVRLIADILSLSFIGGLFIVPLYTFIQAQVLSEQRSSVIAFHNILNAGFMVFASIATFCLLSLNFTIPMLISLCAFGQIGMALYMLRIVPEAKTTSEYT